MPKKYFYILFSFIVFIGCDTGKNSNEKSIENIKENQLSLQQFDWILGTWVGEFEDKTLTEEWGKFNDSKLKGATYYIEGKDTVYFELLTIEIIDNEIYYSADVSKNKEIVSFKLVSEKPNQYIFKNENHDFPTRIKYTFHEPDNLQIEISGKENGERKQLDFYFKKIS